MRVQLKVKRRGEAGFSLIEIIAAMVVISIGMPAIAYMYTTALVSDSDSSARTQAIYLANSLMNEISVRRFKEDVTNPGNGPDTGEITTGSFSRTAFDDIDDYQQFAKTGGWGRVKPPVTEAGVALTDFPGYSQHVTVESIAPPSATGVLSLTPVTAGTTDIKVVKVEVRWFNEKNTATVSKIFTIP